MPAIRKPLRERCNVQLAVKTAIPTSVDDDYYTETPASSDPSTRGRPKARKPIDVRIPYRGTSKKRHGATVHKAPRLHPIDTPTTAGMHSLHRLVPYIYVGCYDGAHLPRSLVSNDGALFTHIVKISHPCEEKGKKAGHRDLQVDLTRGMYCLGLIVPAGCKDEETKGATTLTQAPDKLRLTEEQLLLTRDFLALALPYYAQAHPRDDIPFEPTSDSVRVLITAPAGREAAADIMAVVVCYLAWASEEPVGTVVDYIRAEEEVPGVWKGALGGKEALVAVQNVARFGE
ncbi:hypothetical protein DXG03_006385 [Asterophora parasitica]|uniref:Uncharacterized protein n=1 Tax=Asterophora parasitica TaxID=117018 RepID=A0A9P7KAM1_9AGAR|nr:hypothetical protein DXG03_006385 [Asterophora parasitica]